MSWDIDTWKNIEEFSKENGKEFNDAAEELVKEGINNWKNKKKNK